MDMPPAPARRRTLIRALTLVAADGADQVAWLEKYDLPTDEIALNFDDAFRLAAYLAEEEQLGHAALPYLERITEVFGQMGDDSGADRWSKDALTTDPGWDLARRLARTVLAAEGERDEEPTTG
ncbi:hypothetical protein [Streptomyces sp. NPDC012888]|uniref:hypothetical protein n=1 Tax=Streptomyces sp. NPDC012888 TaxID=3364855 RepID=UPI00368D714E